MDDEEREDLLIRANSDIEDLTDTEETFDASRQNVVQQENKQTSLYDKVLFISTGLVVCFSSTTLIILLPLYLELTDLRGNAYATLLFTCITSIIVLFVLSCVVGKLWKSIKKCLWPPFAFSMVIRIGVLYGVSCFIVIYALERKKVICHLQDPIKGIVLVFSLVYYFLFCRKMMGLQKIFCTTTIIVGLFISVDYGLCDEFRCRGNERERRSEDTGNWSWRSHALWTFLYILGLGLWSLVYTLLEGQLVVCGGLLYIDACSSRLATVSRIVSTRDGLSGHSRPLLQVAPEDNQEMPTQHEEASEARRHVMLMKPLSAGESNCEGVTFPVAMWLHIVALLIILGLFWTHVIPSVGKESSSAEFWNLTTNGLACHFGGYSNFTCNQVATYAWSFVTAYILFVISSLQFLVMSESAVFTVALSTAALPLAGIWWSLFRKVGTITESTVELLEWSPAVTGELICSVLGLPIVVAGLVLLCKAHFKERSYAKVAIACVRHRPTTPPPTAAASQP